eukprot:scaffold38839_cov64-Phaeocystis_antarctica.AAC.7
MAGSPAKEDATEISSAELKDLAPKRAATAPASFPTSAAELRPMLESLREKALPSFNQATSFMREQVASAGLRLQQDTVFSTLEDFERVDPDAKRVVVIGVTGAGKSTVLNCMGGWNFVQKPPDYEFEWQEKDGVDALFEARADCDSCTKKTSFANLAFMGDSERAVVAVDTPGHDDPAGAEIENKEAREKLGEMAADLHNKMKALGHIHAILVLHNDVRRALQPAQPRHLHGAQDDRREVCKVGGGSPPHPHPRPRPHHHPHPHPCLNARHHSRPHLQPPSRCRAGSTWWWVTPSATRTRPHGAPASPRRRGTCRPGYALSLNPNPDPNPSPNPNPNPGLTRTLARVRSHGGDLISQAEIRNKVEMCDHDVPVIALGGGSIDPAPPVATE